MLHDAPPINADGLPAKFRQAYHQKITRKRSAGELRVTGRDGRGLLSERSDPVGSSKSPFNMQQFLKPATGTAWAGIVAAKLLDEFLVAVHNAIPAFDAGFGWESPARLTRDLETGTGRGGWLWSS
jgi:hypothetical protein